MLSWLNPSTLVLCGFLPPLACSLVCSDRVYGNPKVDDCKQALLKIPFARQPIDSQQSRLPHAFAEPQFLKPPFRLFPNAFRPQSIIQLPKIWKHSKSRSENAFSLEPCAIDDRASNRALTLDSCRIALMSQGLSDTPEIVSPPFITTWSDIIRQSARLPRCLTFIPPRGGWISFQCTTLCAPPLIPEPQLTNLSNTNSDNTVPSCNTLHVRQ